MRAEPYLFFDGRCEEALEYYRRAIGAEIAFLVRFGERPDIAAAPSAADKVAHAVVRIGTTTVLASDGQCQGNPRFEGFSISLAVATGAEAETRFAALAEGGRVQVPLSPTPFAAQFGMVADRFGVLWTVVAETAPGAG